MAKPSMGKVVGNGVSLLLLLYSAYCKTKQETDAEAELTNGQMGGLHQEVNFPSALLHVKCHTDQSSKCSGGKGNIMTETI